MPLTVLAADAHPSDWRWQVRHAITDLEGLERALPLTEAERSGVRHALERGFPISITPYYRSLIDERDPACPIRRQCVPVGAEAIESPGDLRDPLGEEHHEVAPELVRRYPDRALLLVSDRCSVYCRFCTRSRMVGAGGGARSLDRLAPAFAYLEAHPEIRDVIVSGGDPLVASTSRVEALLSRLRRIAHLDTVRVATRVPVTLPMRIDDALCRALRTFDATWVMTHFNHPRELSDEASRALARLADHGLPVMNQTVLLRGINDDPGVLERLFRGLVKRRVRPYYLLQADPVRGTGHLRTPIATGEHIMERLQGRLSGIALPKLIVDTPGGRGKVPHGPSWVESRRPGATTFRTFRGELVEYRDPPPFGNSP